jgi:hypothetical protein
MDERSMDVVVHTTEDTPVHTTEDTPVGDGCRKRLETNNRLSDK